MLKDREQNKAIIFFSKELNLIPRRDIRKYIECELNKLPDYFWVVPSSSKGKYHPEYTNGVSGLTRHTKALVYTFFEMCRNETFVSKEDLESLGINLDTFISLGVGAGLLHDGYKYGLVKGEYTTKDHPIIMANKLKEGYNGQIPLNEFNLLYQAIASHMGQWNTGDNGNELMPKPSNILDKMVHLGDYIASRKNIEVKL